MKNDELNEQQINAILKALDDAITQGPWEKTNFLRVMGRNLRGIRDDFEKQVHSFSHKKTALKSYIAQQLSLRRGQKKIYVSIYSSDGSNLRSWEQLINNLPRQIISRPIYADENDVQEIIKLKENKLNEGYVSVYIGDNDILPISPDKCPTDKLGKPMLTLKDKTILLDNVDCFVHQTGIYHYSQGRLTKAELESG